MKNKLVLLVVLFCVLGSAMVSSMNELSHTFKSFFYGTSMAVLILIGLVSIYKYLRKNRSNQT